MEIKSRNYSEEANINYTEIEHSELKKLNHFQELNGVKQGITRFAARPIGRSWLILIFTSSLAAVASRAVLNDF